MLDFNDAPRQLEVIDPAAWNARVEKVRDLLRSRAFDFVREVLPAARIHGGEGRVGNAQGEPGESMSIGLSGDRAGLWHDHATGEGGDLIDLWRLGSHADFRTAVAELEDWLGVGQRPAFTSKVRQVAKVRAEVAARAPKVDSTLPAPSSHWHYLSVSGDILAIVRRYDLEGLDDNGKRRKTFRPFRSDGSHGMPDPRPLYRLPSISTASEVVLVEGEKAADALATIGVEATTQMGGANADPAKTDWTPLAGKTVFVWEDNDAAGSGLSNRVQPSLEAIGCTVLPVTIPAAKPATWDAADAVNDGDDVASLIASARPQSGGAEAFRFNLTFFNEIPDQHHKTWLVRDIFGVNEFTVVYGAPGCGKSVLIGDAAAHVAAGLPWFGKATRPCAVIYIAAERHALVKRRLAAWRQTHGIRDLPLVVLDGLFNLATDPSHADEIIRIARYVEQRTGLKVGWFIVDTKAQVMGGGDENASKDTAVLNNNLARFLAIGAHVTVIDHTPQNDPKRMKGNGGLAGAADGSFLVQNERGSRTLTIGSKAPNDGPDDIALAFKLDSVTLGVNDEGEKTTAPVVVECEAADESDERQPDAKPSRRPGTNQKLVLTALERAARDGQGLGFMRLVGMTKLDKGTLGGVIRTMCERGQIIESPGDPTTYWLP